MKARVIRSFVDKHTLARVTKGAEIEITESRFSELTTGPRGVFVEKIEGSSQVGKSEGITPGTEPPADANPEGQSPKMDTLNEENKEGEPANKPDKKESNSKKAPKK